MQRNAFSLLHNPRLNKGTAFTEAEREQFGLHGLLPPNVSTMTQQVTWILENLRTLPQPIDRYSYLSGLQKRNERLYYRVLIDH
ncbi:MAG: NAD-dependent malic enzyme, partial [Rhodanobacter sp.]